MRTRHAAGECPLHRNPEEGIPRIDAARQAFAVLSIRPGAGPHAPATITSACKDVSGVHDLRVDTARGKIHVLYDGHAATIERAKSVLKGLGLTVSRPEGELSSPRKTCVTEHQV